VYQVGGIEDHVHILTSIEPVQSIAGFMRVVKSGSCLAIRNRFGRDAFRWQSGYGVLTVNPAQVDIVRKYIRNQKQHHRNHMMWPLYERVQPEDEERQKR